MKKNITANEYKRRINRVIDYIEHNLAKDLSLDQLAKTAHFSAFHFHRIFKTVTGETLNQFIKRIRIEKAASILYRNPEYSIKEIISSLGFSSSTSFSRDFKIFFNMSASKWRKQNILYEKYNNQEIKCYSKETGYTSYIHNFAESSGRWTIRCKNKHKFALKSKDIIVKIKLFKPFSCGYIRLIGPYNKSFKKSKKSFRSLMMWAKKNNFYDHPKTSLLSLYHDNHDITEQNSLRKSVCISMPEDIKTDGKMSILQITGGKYACSQFEIEVDEYEMAINSIFGEWFPDSGFQPDEKPLIIFYLGDPAKHPERKHIIEVCIPIKPL